MLKAVGHRVLVKPYDVEETTESGIIIQTPESKKMAQAGQEKGKIVHIGPNAWKAFDDGKPWCEVGDDVIYSQYAGRVVEDPSDKETRYVILNDEDILTIVDSDQTKKV